MAENFFHKIAKSKSSTYFTPIIERLVYGLVYPAVLGASLVEFGLRTKVFSASIPWVLLLLVFIVDFTVTASESSEAAPKGNLFTVMADFVAALAFLGAYIISVSWDGATEFSGDKLRGLVFVLFGLHLAYFLWYLFRWLTRNLAGVPEDLIKDYVLMLQRNSTVLTIQTILVGSLGLRIINGHGGVQDYHLMMAIVFVGVLVRVINDFRLGPITRMKTS